MSLNIMLGTLFRSPKLLFRIQFSGIKIRSNYEYTRFRKKPRNGERFVQNNSDIYSFNAWDNVEWDEEQENHAKESVAKNSVITLSDDELRKYESEADRFWDEFYDIHQNRFFKDRQWIFTEFPEIAPHYKDAPERVYPEDNCRNTNMPDNTGTVQNERSIFEIGCGVGNTIIPILKHSAEENLKVYGCDFSSKAIDILKEQPEYDQRCSVFVLDATSTIWVVPFAENSLDIIILIFVLSAIHPDKFQHVANQCFKYLKPGGVVILRDYGRYDLAQLRFKPGKCLQDNFYVRGDGTCVYFFTQDELKHLFNGAGFIEEQNLIDRRLQVNRQRMLKMYRIWIQTKFRKPMAEVVK